MTQKQETLIALCVCRAQADAPQTDAPRDAAYPARFEVLHIPSAGVAINGVAYVASGRATHPTLVICHGWPGNEKNLDLAHDRRLECVLAGGKRARPRKDSVTRADCGRWARASADALVAAVRAQGGTRIQTQHFTTDHSWSDSRIALQNSIIDWLQTLPK